MKKLCLCLSIIMLLTVFVGCDNKREFDTEWIIGKNSKQIIERYGEFVDVREYDHTPIILTDEQKQEGIYAKCLCYYIIEKLNKIDELRLVISFNSEGIATGYCEEYWPIGG